MTLDYGEIGKRIARRRKELGLKQSEVEEKADLSYKYLSNIERSVSIPSLEVIMRLAAALDTTPDELLVGTLRDDDPDWKTVAEPLRTFDTKKLSGLARGAGAVSRKPPPGKHILPGRRLSAFLLQFFCLKCIVSFVIVAVIDSFHENLPTVRLAGKR